MSVWLCIPSKRPPEEANKVLRLWRERGYKIALWVDDPYIAEGQAYAVHFDGMSEYVADVLILAQSYPGYSQATNETVRYVLRKHDPDCQWVVLGGDDVEPDANHGAEEIAQQCSEHFMSLYRLEFVSHEDYAKLNTFGVMQPIGDRWGDRQGPYIERVCGSPWIGREFALRINQGRGPLWPEYTHMFEDEELQAVAEKYGALWQRRDLTHYHRHWARQRADVRDRPAWLEEVSGPEHWKKYSALFRERKAAGFPGSQPL